MMKRRRKPASEKPAAPPRQPPSRAPAALSVFTEAGIEVSQHEDDTWPWTVAGRFYFWPVTGMWRAIDNSRSGYSASSLRRVIRDDAGKVAEAERLHRAVADGQRAVETALAAALQDHQDERVVP